MTGKTASVAGVDRAKMVAALKKKIAAAKEAKAKQLKEKGYTQSSSSERRGGRGSEANEG